MDWSSFFGGVVAALSGVVATVLVTERIEAKKHGFEAKKALERLYVELADLQEESADSLFELQDTYCRAWNIEKNIQNSKMWNGVSIPKPPSTIVLESHVEKSLGELTPAQRKGIRTILHLCREAELSISVLMQNICEDRISTRNVKHCISILCVLYHVSLNMKEQEERYVEIGKSPNRVYESVLSSLGIDLSFEACRTYESET
ncbi:hypothetical protein P4S72_27250 [Vibrio sp. PP-XX7]